MTESAAIGRPVRRVPPPRYRKLIEVATDLFSRNGYEATTIRQIADEMGIKSASLYSHVGSKAEILREIVLDVAREFTESAIDSLVNTQGPEEQLHTLCRAHMRVMENRAAAVIVYFHQWRKLSLEYQDEIISLRREYEDMFRSVLTAGITDGLFREVDVAHSVRVLLGALNWTYEWRSPRRGITPEEMSDRILETIITGLRKV